MANTRLATSLLLIIIVTLSVSTVDAQNTTLTNLVYPTAAVSGETATVTFDLSYSGLASTEGLIAAILDPVTNDIVNGMVSSSPNQCISLAATQYVGEAACVWHENGFKLSSANTGSTAMLTAHTITALWVAGYLTPVAILIAIGASAGISILFLGTERRKDREEVDADVQLGDAKDECNVRRGRPL